MSWQLTYIAAADLIIQESTESIGIGIFHLVEICNLCMSRITLHTQVTLLLLHCYCCCQSETRENTSMLISMIFLYAAGVIFI